VRKGIMGNRFLITVAILFAGWGFFTPLPATVAEEAAEEATEEATPSQDNNAGLKDLDEATLAKLTAESVQDLADVIDQCELALSKGLEENHATLAKQLLVTTRVERATFFSSKIFGELQPDRRWRQFRQLAMSDLEKALEHAPDNPEIHVLMGRLLSLPGNPDDHARAVALLNKAIDLYDDDKSQISKALAFRAAAQSDPEKRAADLNESIELDPRNLDAIRTRAVVRIRAREYEEAIADLERAIELDPENPRTHEALATVFRTLNRNDEAIERLSEAIKLAPESPSAWVERARIYFLDGKYKLSAADSEAALKLAPRNATIQMMHAQTLHQLGQTKEALRLVTKLLIAQPRLAQAINLRARLLADDGKQAEAIAVLERARKREPQNPQFLLTLGMLYVASKQGDKAVEMFDLLLAGGVEMAVVYRSRADALLSINRQAEALADYQKALKEDPQNPGILNNLAWLMATSPLDELRDGNKALELATEACRLTEYGEAYILSTLAAAHAEAGDFGKAIEWAEKAVELSGEDVQDQIRSELESYRKQQPWREAQGAEEDAAEGAASDGDAVDAKPSPDEPFAEETQAEETVPSGSESESE